MKLPERRIWFGSEEPIFNVLPANVLANFRTPRSENALLWNTIYRLARPKLRLRDLLAIQPIWGTRGVFDEPDDELLPYFWGFDVEGRRLDGLEEALRALDGPGPSTEVDLFLFGEHHLIAVEAKHTSGFGRCSRYQQTRCPEIHPDEAVEDSCRYWELDEAKFSRLMRMGSRPDLTSDAPPCTRHYQLCRTYLIGDELARRHNRTFSLWAIVSTDDWRSLELDWLDFADRVRNSDVWRRMRVIPWGQLRDMDSG
ncbi:MAG: hypothetical protein PVF85_06375 [Anaerolineales bacterium]